MSISNMAVNNDPICQYCGKYLYGNSFDHGHNKCTPLYYRSNV